MRGIVLDAEVILVGPPRIKPTLRVPVEPVGSDSILRKRAISAY